MDMNPLTYLIFALALAYILDKRLLTASIFALVPSIDVLIDFRYPFVHHGIMHSLLAAVVFSLLIYVYTEDQESAESCFLGYSSHLFLDLLTAPAIPLLFPLAHELTLALVSPYSPEANTAIITASLAGMYMKKNWRHFQPLIPETLTGFQSR